MGLANLVWMPLALCFGKRPVVLVSMAMFVAGIIWTVVAKDYNSLMGARVFASFGILPTIPVFFLHPIGWVYANICRLWIDRVTGP